MAIGCVIFDCDGTLVDSELLSNVALSRTLAALSVHETPSALLQRYRGARLANILVDLGQRHERTLPDAFEGDYRRLVSELFESELCAIDGALEVVRALSWPGCVASSGPRAKIELALRVTGLSSFFRDKIFSSYEIGSWKPEPLLFLHASAAMGVPADACAVVEDSSLGAQAAQAAGMRCLLFDPQAEHSHRDTFGASTFSSMRDLLGLLRGL